MKPWLYGGIGFCALWFQLSVSPHLALFGLKPNFLLLTVLVLGLRWKDRWLFLYAVGAGLALDVFSHGMLGLYGLSFFFIAFLARLAGGSIYENTWWITASLVFGLSLAEGIFSLTLFEIVAVETPWWSWLFGEVIPVSLYHALLSPLLLIGVARLEKLANFPKVTPGP